MAASSAITSSTLKTRRGVTVGPSEDTQIQAQEYDSVRQASGTRHDLSSMYLKRIGDHQKELRTSRDEWRYDRGNGHVHREQLGAMGIEGII